jgi:hypothetical protein
LNGVDSAFLSNSAIVPTIQGALHALTHEKFIDTYNSEQCILEEVAIDYSLEKWVFYKGCVVFNYFNTAILKHKKN